MAIFLILNRFLTKGNSMSGYVIDGNALCSVFFAKTVRPTKCRKEQLFAPLKEAVVICRPDNQTNAWIYVGENGLKFCNLRVNILDFRPVKLKVSNELTRVE